MKTLIVILFTCSQLFAQQGSLSIDKQKRTEAEWSNVIKEHILMLSDFDQEFTLPASQRIDLFDQFDKIAYEVDWAEKWPEGIGQSLVYAIKTNTKPGLILLIKTGEDEYYLNAMLVINDLRRRGYDYSFIVVNVDNLKYWRF